jgi:putative phosphoserine phosphatase/1-acylglycerol-3-phosphate O-acyltransferase
MKHYAHVTAEVDQSRGGRTTAAFFDFDGTLIAGYSILSFLRHRALSGNMPPREAIEQLVAGWEYGLNLTDFAGILKQTAASLRGVSERLIQETALQIYETELSGSIYPESRALVDAHVEKGHTVVIVSSASQYQVQHVAAELGIEHVLCNRLDVADGALSGELVPPICYGQGKLEAATEFARQNNVSLGKSYFYTDGGEDMPLLEAVGFPRPLNPDNRLLNKARRYGWPVQNFGSRGLPSFWDVARTGLVYGGFVGSFLAGLPGWFLNKSRRELINTAIPIWGDFGSAAAGLNVEITGEEHLWSHRPAVFVFNHQSATDALILARLLRRNFSGVAKAEMQSNPLVGTILGAVGTMFIDRGNHERAVEALQPAVNHLRKGISIAIAPEGHRSLGYKLGPFKMGAFHIAMQAGAPIMPIGIQNSSDSMPSSGAIIRPANINVDVLPPVATDAWTNETIHEHAEEVRHMFLKKLGQISDDHTKLRSVN